MRSRIPDEWFEVEHMSPYERIRTAAEFVKERLGEADTAIVLGSGLGVMTDCLENAVTMQSTEIPGYPVSTVPGHSGTWWKGSIQGKSTFMLQGRVHAYEGIPVQDVVMYVRILKCLGVKTLILTNAAGCANPEWNAGDIMAISDHINLSGLNPLVGPNLDSFGPRFPDMTEAYSRKLRVLASETAASYGIPLREGVYAWFLGPTYETPAEVRMARILGADAVGMSTAPEVIAARHCGMDVLAFSCMTNMAAGLNAQPLNHEEVLEAGLNAGRQMQTLILGVLKKLSSVNE